MPRYAILYLPGATQIVTVSTNFARRSFARPSVSTNGSGSCRVIVSPGLTARLIGIAKPSKGGGTRTATSRPVSVVTWGAHSERIPQSTVTSDFPLFRTLTVNLALSPIRTLAGPTMPSCNPSTSFPHATLSLISAAGFAGSFTSNSTVPVASFGWIMPPYAILYFPGATQIVGPATGLGSSDLARSSGSTNTVCLYTVIVSPGLRVHLIGTEKPLRGGGG